jgi:hypothetical protein
MRLEAVIIAKKNKRRHINFLNFPAFFVRVLILITQKKGREDLKKLISRAFCQAGVVITPKSAGKLKKCAQETFDFYLLLLFSKAIGGCWLLLEGC